MNNRSRYSVELSDWWEDDEPKWMELNFLRRKGFPRLFSIRSCELRWESKSRTLRIIAFSSQLSPSRLKATPS
jgi:hypothetical protein